MKKTVLACAAVLVLLLSGCSGGSLFAQTPTDSEAVPHTTAATPETTQAPPSTSSAPEETTCVPTEPTTQVPTDPPALSLSREEQYRINLFLSNFSEQWFHEGWIWQDSQSQGNMGRFVSKDADPMELVSFAWLYAKINLEEHEAVTQGDHYYCGVSFDTVNRVCQRFFDRSITQADIVPIACFDGYYNYCLIDGMVCCMAGDGDTYNNMTVANAMYSLGDGTYRVDFRIYSISDMGGDDSIVLSGSIVQDKSVYYYTDAEAAANSYFSYYRSGSAVVRPYTTAGGTESYQLISYDLF